MGQLNRIESKQIKWLEPHDLVTLLRFLLYAEAKHRRATVHVPLQIYVPDGGEDGRWEGEVSPDEFIPDKFTLYQVKAEELGPSQCADEMLAGAHQVKPAIVEVLASNGCYVFFCGHPYVESALTRRVNAARRAILDTGRQLTRPDQIRFLDANKIAAWANRHASAVAYVCECCQLRQTVSFRTWQDWRRDPIFRLPIPFQSDERLNTFSRSLSQHLLVAGNVARVTGLSGLGKTRLVSEALRPTTDPSDVNQATLSHSTVYFDMELSPPGVLDTISQLELGGFTGTVVVDNCPSDQHLKLAEIIRRDRCKLSLVTLDYVPEPPRSGILHIQLEPEMMLDIVPSILKQLPKAQYLSVPQLNHIASFAHGFPQIAALI